MAQTATASHHHRSTTKQDHKSFKSKHATKSAIKDRAKGKVEDDGIKRHRSPQQQVISKLQRRNQAKQSRINHKEKLDRDSIIFQGADGAAKHIAMVPLSDGIDVRAAIDKLSESVDVRSSCAESGPTRIRIDRFNRNLLYLPAKPDLINALDVCKLADWVVFLVTSDQILGPDEDMLLRAIEGQGITSTAVIVTDIESKFPANKVSKKMTDIKTQFSTYFAALDKYIALENKSDCANLIRSLCSATPKGISWRDDRSWMLIDSVDWKPSSDGLQSTNAFITGTVRGKNLNPNRLVHLQGWGEYKIKRIIEIPPQVRKRNSDEMVADTPAREWPPTSDQDDLDELAPETAEMTDASNIAAPLERKGVLLDDHHYFSDHDLPNLDPKKLPIGTSSYQAAWYEFDSDNDEAEADEEMVDVDGDLTKDEDAMTDTGYPSEHVDAMELSEFRASHKKNESDHLEFPDEIELHPDVLARERLAKYRGLKSLRSSEWSTEEDKLHEPKYWNRLLPVREWKQTCKSTDTEVAPGTRVEIEIDGVPESQHTHPSALYSLLPHEHKLAVININLTLSSSSQEIRSKEELIMQVGHRRFLVNPIFSDSGARPSNNVHKLERFLHPGRGSSVATFIGPITWGSVPVLVFRRHRPAEPEGTIEAPSLPPSASASTPPSSELDLIATATTLPSHERIVVKRIILTGQPFKIHKKLVTVRYMFFNREDVSYFASLPLFTKRGTQGRIKEPLGTHGYFKSLWEGRSTLSAMDTIGVALYKRMYPRICKRLE